MDKTTLLGTVATGIMAASLQAPLHAETAQPAVKSAKFKFSALGAEHLVKIDDSVGMMANCSGCGACKGCSQGGCHGCKSCTAMVAPMDSILDLDQLSEVELNDLQNAINAKILQN